MQDGQWFLERLAADGALRRHRLAAYPCRIGRHANNDLVLRAPGLSRHHAELQADVSGRLRLVDLDSSNGCYVNRERVTGSALLDDGDMLQFGGLALRLRQGEDRAEDLAGLAPEPALQELLDGQGLSAAIQPIVLADDRSLFAWELLGRAEHPKLPGLPIPLFQLASTLQREAALSRALREHGVRTLAAHAQQHPDTPLFLNAHPKESFEPSLLLSLARLQTEWPSLAMVVELHQAAVTDIERLRGLTDRLQALGLQFAYDGVDASPVWLRALSEVPPHFVKVDRGLVRGLHEAGERRQRVVADLVRLVHELGAMAMALGVETEAEMAVCRRLGFELIQGRLTGDPMPIPAD